MTAFFCLIECKNRHTPIASGLGLQWGCLQKSDHKISHKDTKSTKYY